MAGSPFCGFASTGEEKGCICFVVICNLSSYFICREDIFEKILLQKMSPEGILSGLAIQEGEVATAKLCYISKKKRLLYHMTLSKNVILRR